MRTWAVIMQKGGVGRTVLTVGLGCHAAQHRIATLAINLDRQLSLDAWSKRRSMSRVRNERLEVISSNLIELPSLLEDARRQGVGLTIVDTPSHAKGEIIEVCRLSEIVLTPVRPSVWDTVALRETIEIVSQSRTNAYNTAFTTALDKALVVLNCVDSRSSEAEQALEAIEDFGIRHICTARITERIEVRKAAAVGQGVSEFAPQGKSAAEFAELFNEIVDWQSGAEKVQTQPSSDALQRLSRSIAASI